MDVVFSISRSFWTALQLHQNKNRVYFYCFNKSKRVSDAFISSSSFYRLILLKIGVNFSLSTKSGDLIYKSS